MSRGKRIGVIEFPFEDPEKVVWVIPQGIPVEIPRRETVDVPAAPREEPKKKEMPK